MIPFIKKLLMRDTAPAFYDAESVTAIEATAKLQASMNSLIEATNKFADNVNTTLNEFIDQQTTNDNTFKVALRQEFQDFIDTIDLKVRDLETLIEGPSTKINYIDSDGSGIGTLVIDDVVLEDTPATDGTVKHFHNILVNRSDPEKRESYHPVDLTARKLIDDLFSAKTKQDNQNESFKQGFRDVVSTLSNHKETLDEHEDRITTLENNPGGAEFSKLVSIKAGEDVRFFCCDVDQLTSIETFEVRFNANTSEGRNVVLNATVYMKPMVEGDSYISVRSATEDETFDDIYLPGTYVNDFNQIFTGYMLPAYLTDIESVGTFEVLSSSTNLAKKMTDGAIRLSFLFDYLK